MKISEIIYQVIENDLQCIQNGIEEGDSWWIHETLGNGSVGYNNQTLAEIKQEYEERFGVPADEDEPIINDLKLK